MDCKFAVLRFAVQAGGCCPRPDLSYSVASTTILSIHLDSTKHLAMGVNDLWDMLEPAATMVPIVSLALSDRYIGPAPHSPYVVGIDARLVLCVD